VWAPRSINYKLYHRQVPSTEPAAFNKRGIGDLHGVGGGGAVDIQTGGIDP